MKLIIEIINLTLIKLKNMKCFSDKYDFYNDISIIDLIFNLGPETTTYLERQSI